MFYLNKQMTVEELCAKNSIYVDNATGANLRMFEDGVDYTMDDVLDIMGTHISDNHSDEHRLYQVNRLVELGFFKMAEKDMPDYLLVNESDKREQLVTAFP